MFFYYCFVCNVSIILDKAGVDEDNVRTVEDPEALPVFRESEVDRLLQEACKFAIFLVRRIFLRHFR